MQEDTRLHRLMVGDSSPTATVEKEVAESDNNIVEIEQQMTKDTSVPIPCGNTTSRTETIIIDNKMDDGADSEILACWAEPYVCPFKYHPVDQDWQKRTCSILKMKYCGSNRVSPGGPNVSLKSPLIKAVLFQPVIGGIK